MDSSNIDSLMSDIREKVRIIEGLWYEVGARDDKLLKRTINLKSYVIEFFDKLIKEETNRRDNLIISVKQLEEHLNELSKELKLEIEIPADEVLIVKESALLKLKSDLITIKNHRIARLNELQGKEKKLCERLQICRRQCDYGVPSIFDINNFETYINNLEDLKETIKKQLKPLRQKIIKLVSVLNRKHFEDGFMESILKENALDIMPLTEDVIKSTKNYINWLENDVESNRQKCLDLRTKLNSFCHVIYGSAEKYPNQKLRDTNDITDNTVKKLEEEISRLKIIREEKMAEFIENSKKKMRWVLTQCLVEHFVEEEPYKSLLSNQEYSEQYLIQLEEEIQNWEGVSEIIAPLLLDIGDFSTAAVRWKNHELKLKDSEVQKNRGGILLKTQREVSDYRKEVQKFENKIKKHLINIEEQHIDSQILRVNGMSVLDYVNLKKNRSDDKENEKKINKSSKLKNAASTISIYKSSCMKNSW